MAKTTKSDIINDDARATPNLQLTLCAAHPYFPYLLGYEVTKLLDHFKRISFANLRTDSFSVLYSSFENTGEPNRALIFI